MRHTGRGGGTRWAPLIVVTLALCGGRAWATGADAVLDDIRQQTAELIGTPRTVKLPSEEAASMRAALHDKDFAKAREIVAAVLKDSVRLPWSFSPFGEFMAATPLIANDLYGAELSDWVEASPDDALAPLVRARYHFETAWARRNNGAPSAFDEEMRRATADIAASIRLDASNPSAAALQLLILGNAHDTPGLDAAFAAAVAKFPGFYALYDVRLRMLSPRWGGSIKKMYDFADASVGKAASDDPLRLLHLRLYALLLDAAAMDCARYGGDINKLKQCVAATMRTAVTPKLESDVQVALQLAAISDKYRFGVAVAPILGEMVRTWGGDINAGAVLQLAASAMGSDNRLTRDASGHNSYVTDMLAGDVWFKDRFYDNAETKYQHAVDDIATTSFPGELERDVALSEAYHRLAEVYQQTSQHRQTIAYTDAAIALGGDNPHGVSYQKCRAYFMLKLYAAGMDACSEMLAHGGGFGDRYWRARNEQSAGRADDALQDYAMVADSGPVWGTAAAINMSVLQGDRKDYKAMLETLNGHVYLYDEQHQSNDDLAIAYNNRCFAYMKLGELQKALTDCTSSLKFGSLPDAYSKQQELVKRLTQKDPGSRPAPKDDKLETPI